MAGSRVRRLQKEKVEMEECLSHFPLLCRDNGAEPASGLRDSLPACPRPGEMEAPKVSVLGGISWRELTD